MAAGIADCAVASMKHNMQQLCLWLMGHGFLSAHTEKHLASVKKVSRYGAHAKRIR